jgi:hypothetical protein
LIEAIPTSPRDVQSANPLNQVVEAQHNPIILVVVYCKLLNNFDGTQEPLRLTNAKMPLHSFADACVVIWVCTLKINLPLVCRKMTLASTILMVCKQW